MVGGEMREQNRATAKRAGRWASGGVGALLVAGALLASQDAVNISRGDFGWQSVVLNNPAAEVIVVPSIGRVMSFRLARPNGTGDATPFWRNAALSGKAVDPASSDWLNFGGDKTGPAPQSQWSQLAGRAWPPPAGFDAAVNQAELPGHRPGSPGERLGGNADAIAGASVCGGVSAFKVCEWLSIAG